MLTISMCQLMWMIALLLVNQNKKSQVLLFLVKVSTGRHKEKGRTQP
jgi:hypothetical protein